MRDDTGDDIEQAAQIARSALVMRAGRSDLCAALDAEVCGSSGGLRPWWWWFSIRDDVATEVVGLTVRSDRV
jgi:hypothetical protein